MAAFSRAVFMMLLAVAAATVVRAGDFEAANEKYDEGKFAEAKQIYERLVETGEGSANVFYNLGNADFRLGSEGRAMLNFERALALSPRHPEARANLTLLRERAASKLGSQNFAITLLTNQPLSFWVATTAVTTWASIFGVLFLITSRRANKAPFRLLALGGMLCCTICGAGVWFGLRNETLAIVTAKVAEARLAPAASAGLAEALPAGSRVRVLSERGTWSYCELPNAGRGWLPAVSIERVRPEPS